MLSSEEKTVVFIDGANLYAIARGLEFDIDYKKLLALFREQAPEADVITITADVSNEDDVQRYVDEAVAVEVLGRDEHDQLGTRAAASFFQRLRDDNRRLSNLSSLRWRSYLRLQV